MTNLIPGSVKKMWDEWNIRGVILLSLSLQAFLILFAPFRKGTANKFIIMLIWSAYLLADWAANFAVGLISNSQGDTRRSMPEENNALLALWAPFLLLHLGGPDTITAFALEDNELWLRHLLGLVFQAVATLYVFLQSLPLNKLVIPTILMFIAGILKYYERCRALYLASLDRFRDSMLKDPDPGPNYAKLMEEYATKKEAGLPTKIITIRERDSKASGISEGKTELNYLDVVRNAYEYFNIFKGLLVDLIFSYLERDRSRAFFHNLKPEYAFRVIEVELNFIYEVLYTKVEVIHSVLGYVVRFISSGSVVAAFSVFHFEVKKHRFDNFDVRITYTLFLGAICLDAISLLMHLFSDWILAALTNRNNESGLTGKMKLYLADIICSFLNILKRPRWKKCQTQHPVELEQEVLATPFLLRRWSGSVSGHNLIRYCLKGHPTRVHIVKSRLRLATEAAIHYWGINQAFHNIVKIIDEVIHNSLVDKMIQFVAAIIKKIIYWLGLADFFDEIRYVSREPLPKGLWEFIYEDLKSKAYPDNGPENAKRIYSARGDWILEKSKRKELKSYVSDVAYDESILIWHIATELLYHNDKQIISAAKAYNAPLEFSKILSDYMLYLLVMQPTMMSAVAGIGKIRFRDTCAEATRFIERKGLKPDDEKRACEKILDVNTEVKPVTVKGDRSKSVLFDASMLAKQLNSLEEDEDEEMKQANSLEEGEDEEVKKMEKKWALLSKVWVEMLSYAATHCSARTHAQHVSKGGELITFVWLLMAHFGLGEQFQINKGQERAKLIVGK